MSIPDELIKNLPEIIRAAASSNLGVAALMVIVLAALSFGFFRNSSNPWKFASLLLLFIGCSLFIRAMYNVIPDQHTGLSSYIKSWITVAEKSRNSETVSQASQLPTEVIEARNKFEMAWKQAPLAERRSQDSYDVSRALSYINRLYRVVEQDSSLKQNSLFWSDEAVVYFNEVQNKQYLTEALLDKAAIYLDIAQLGNNDREQFNVVARDGGAIMVRAYALANEKQRPRVLRVSSRFYYNLSRPASFRLSDDWDNNYLLLAYDKAKEAFGLDSNDIKNVNQMTRVVIRASKNMPQDSDDSWKIILREAQRKMKNAWLTNQSKLNGLNERLSPLDVLGVSTFEIVAREWKDLSSHDKSLRASDYLAEIDSDALTTLREAIALLHNSELRKSYGFDLYYDMSRAFAVKIAVCRAISPQRACKEFDELKKNLLVAKENAKTSQLQAAIRDVDREITFSLLANEERIELKNLLSI